MNEAVQGSGKSVFKAWEQRLSSTGVISYCLHPLLSMVVFWFFQDVYVSQTHTHTHIDISIIKASPSELLMNNAKADLASPTFFFSFHFFNKKVTDLN